MEGWIGECQNIFPGEGIRDFWESIWNLSVAAWNYIDILGEEPWKTPRLGFPYSTPAFWKGSQWFTQLFIPVDEYLNRFEINDHARFKEWILTILRFQFPGTSPVPMGMAALALNSPSESYLLDCSLEELQKNLLNLKLDGQIGEDSNPEGTNTRQTGWKVPFLSHGNRFKCSDPIIQVFFDSPVEGLAAPTIVMVLTSLDGGNLYFRTGERVSDEEAASLVKNIQAGEGWEVGLSSPTLAGCDWPWLGPVRALLAARGSMLDITE